MNLNDLPADDDAPTQADLARARTILADPEVRWAVRVVQLIQRAEAEVPAEVICPCGHTLHLHNDHGCGAHVPVRIGGSTVCCTRTPAEVLAAQGVRS